MRSFDLSFVFARQTYDLAVNFVDLVRAACVGERAGVFETIRERNQTAQYSGGACAAHDFFDANMIMDAAFKKTLGRGAWLGSDVEDGRCTEAQHVADTELWNHAWAFARSTGMI